MDAVATAKDRMTKTIGVLERELAGLRAGRANPQALDRIMADYYGTPTSINQMGNVSSPEARLLVIAPYDASMIKEIEKAIQKSDLGINPTNDGKLVRLVFPELTEERRRDLVKIVHKKGEEAKVAIRAIRRDANDHIDKQKKDGEITEDDQKKMKDQTQKATDSFIKDIDKILADKEKEILSV